ncbi:MAG: hypothetical protein L0Z62_29125 [Gemmataceae bacterium]|nr:hypothetical protein [Gemmataceae bacterium]
MSRLFLAGLLVLVVPYAWGPSPILAQKQEGPAAAKPREYELKIVRVGNTFQGLRYKVRTGESWMLSGDRYEKVPETTPVPAGDYEVTLITDDTNWMAFRIDRVSGATWQLRGNRWVRFKEPDAKGE